MAPLDWGLGHATRCIPLIRELLAQGAEVWLAGEREQEHLLKTEFPDLPFLQLAGYRIRYAKTARGLIWQMIQQGPKLRRAIRTEHEWLKKIMNDHFFDAVISDNRYGLYHPGAACIFITHQLTIKSPFGKWTERLLQKRNYRYINRFMQCWVPDFSGDAGLAGELSHPVIKPAVPLRYIGLLSRIEKTAVPEEKNHLCVLLSGPEPQRSLLEEKIINDISHYNGAATVIRGLPGAASLIPSTSMIRFYNHLPAADLNREINRAAFVISRSGYSTVMDIAAAKKKSILIPTPGQTEQEYLAVRLMEKKSALCISQKEFQLDNALTAAGMFNYTEFPLVNSSLLTNAVAELMTAVTKK